jgi:hypothetical protein
MRNKQFIFFMHQFCVFGINTNTLQVEFLSTMAMVQVLYTKTKLA